MEFKNAIEIQGFVGNAHGTPVGDDEIVRFSVVTDYVFQDRTGSPVVESTWVQCVAWKSQHPDVAKISRRTAVNVKGRLVMRRYVASDGSDRLSPEILATEVTVIDDTA